MTLEVPFLSFSRHRLIFWRARLIRQHQRYCPIQCLGGCLLRLDTVVSSWGSPWFFSKWLCVTRSGCLLKLVGAKQEGIWARKGVAGRIGDLLGKAF